MVSPQIQKLAQHLLILERMRVVASDADTNLAVRVIEQFRVRLIKLVGVYGFRSLLSRTLNLAKRESPALAGVRIGENGALEGVAEMGKNEADELVLVAQLLALLTTFIGESLTLQLVRDAWPAAASPEAIEEAKS